MLVDLCLGVVSLSIVKQSIIKQGLMVEKSSAPNKNQILGTEHLNIKGSGFISENTGNIKDFYKISSCIGRGKLAHPLC
jgi:hypothetical protein